MKKIILLFITLIQTILSLKNVCEFQPDILSKSVTSIKDSNIHFYVPILPLDRKPNSIIICNEFGMILDCLNEQDFIKQNNIDAETIFFLHISHAVRDIYSIFYINFSEDSHIRGEARIIFVDDFFNLKEDLPTVYINDNIKTPLFKNGTLNLHDIIVDESLNHAIIIIRERHIITDAQELFPDTPINDFIFNIDSLCLIDLKTGKEIGAISGNGIFADLDQWWEYLGHLKEHNLFFKYFVNSPIMTEYIEYDATYINSISLVDGSHFSSKYRNKKLILINSRLQDTMYLLRWDLESIESNDNLEIIWKLPSINAPEIIKKEWYHRWEYVNDPFYGPSRSHDLNIYNLPKGHILMLDNGGLHRTANKPNLACPMSRCIEYKIEMDANGLGYHKITLVFSYPKVEDYPEWIYLEENEGPEFKEEECKDFWKEYNYQTFIGSCRKTEKRDYVMTSFPNELLLLEKLDEFPLMIKLDNKGNVINEWFNLNGLSSSYRIIPLKRDEFRNGLYLRSNNMDNSSLYVI